MKRFKLVYLLLAIVLASPCLAQKNKSKNIGTVWTSQQAHNYMKDRKWLSGCNYIPATAINQIEMWHKDTFDEPTIDKELGWAEELGFNTMRVFLSSIVWQNDPQGMINRMNRFLGIAQKHNITPIFCVFDDCWNPEATYGKQPSPKRGVHNSGWLRDPSMSIRSDSTLLYSSMKSYLKAILTRFKNDKRILMWDLYNEPGNNNLGNQSLPFLKKVFEWAREVNPSQPITSGIWNLNLIELNKFQLQNSDIITYHNYLDSNEHEIWIKFLKLLNKPMVCTEYMARKNHSLFFNIMPLLKKNDVGAINWGFVSGKTNTIFAWDSPLPDYKEPVLWFHDIYRQDKTPFDQKEVDFIKKINQEN